MIFRYGITIKATALCQREGEVINFFVQFDVIRVFTLYRASILTVFIEFMGHDKGYECFFVCCIDETYIL